MRSPAAHLSLSRDSILPAIVIIVLLALPFAVWEFFQTGELYIFSHRFWPDLIARLHGPGRMRFILQPTVAVLLGARDGVKDCRANKPPFVWGLVFHCALPVWKSRVGCFSVSKSNGRRAQSCPAHTETRANPLLRRAAR
jgi:hypothetical protein